MTKWWDDGADVIVFSRGTLGFFVLNNESAHELFTHYFEVDLPDGVYCDVITCDTNRPISDECTNESISGSDLDQCRSRHVLKGIVKIIY